MSEYQLYCFAQSGNACRGADAQGERFEINRLILHNFLLGGCD